MNKRFTIFSAISSMFLVAFATSTGTHAATQPYTIPDDGKCPVDRVQKSGPWVVAFSGAFGVTAPNSKAIKTRVQPEWGESLSAVQDNPESGFLLVKNIKGSCFWVLKNKLVNFESPLKAVDPNDNGDGQPSKSPLWKKVLIRNKADGQITSGAELFNEPGGAPTGGWAKLFAVYHVYLERTAPDSSGRQIEYLLVGASDKDIRQKTSDDLSDEAKASALGWVKAEDVIYWSSHLTASTAARMNDRVPVYRSEAELREGSSPMGYFPSLRDEPLDVNFPRYPILDDLERTPHGRIHKIAFPGNACGTPGAARRNCISAENAAIVQAHLATVAEAARDLDITFLIDNTESMQAYFPLVISAVRQVTGKAKGGTTRYGAAVYGDYTGERAGEKANLQYRVVSHFGTLGTIAGLDALNQVETYSDMHQDAPEAMLAALLRTIADFRWRPTPARRIIILIGDDGARDSSSFHNMQETLSTTDVGKKLGDAQIALFAINVRGKGHADWNKQFRKQASEIVTAASSPGSKRFPGVVLPAFDIDAGTEDLSKVPDKVAGVIEEALSFVKTGDDVFKDMRGGKSLDVSLDNAEKKNSLVSVALVEDWIRKNLKVDDIEDLYSRSQIVEYGYVSKANNFAMDQVDYWVAVDRPKMYELENSIGKLCNSMTSPNAVSALNNVFMAAVESSSGDYLPRDTPLSEYMERLYHIPGYRNHSKLKSIDDIQSMIHDVTREKEREDFIRHVCKSAKMLRLVVEKSRTTDDNLEWRNNDGELNGWIVKEKNKLRKFYWEWGSYGGVSYYYIPISYLP